MRAACVLPVVLAASLITGCAVGPKYQKPKLAPPADFRQLQQPTAESLADQAWWQIFQDEVLQQLVREAIRNNYDLKVAAIRVEQARLTARIDAAALYPQVGINGSVDRTKNPPFASIASASFTPQVSP